MPMLPGPRGGVRCTRDAWGYPTIQVRTVEEGLWARGYLHATDRLLQAQLAAMVAEGRAMEILGDAPFARRMDRATRALGLPRGLDAAVERMGPELAAELQTYCDGFNAGAQDRGTPLPMRLLGLQVRTWTVRDVLLVHRLLGWFGLTSTTLLAKAVTAELLAAGVDGQAVRTLLGPGGEGLDLEACREVDWARDEALIGSPLLGGSNAFGIAGSRTTSGGAIVLAEFHMEVGQLPPVLYAVDERRDDGSYVVGVGFPGEPHTLAGRTPDVAWAYTFGHGDNIDVFADRVDRDRVWRHGAWEDVAIRDEAVRPRGLPSEVWRFRDVADGSTILGAGDGHHPAIRWRGLDDPIVDHVVLRELLTVTSVDAAVAVHRRVRTLSTAAVFGDRSGRIAWMHTGAVAATRAGWGPRHRDDVGDDPDRAEADRPVVVDPPEGVVGSANEAVPGWTVYPEPPYRKQRLMELLARRPVWDLDAACRITLDEVDRCATRLLGAWALWLPATPEARALTTWARAQDSVDPDVAHRYRQRFHRLHHEAMAGLMAELVGRPLADHILLGLGLGLAFQAAVDDLLAGDHPDRVAADVLERIVQAAWEASAVPGPSAALDRVRFVNAVTQGAEPAFLGLSPPAMRAPGGPTSLFQMRQVPFLGHTIVGGPAFRLVMDLGADGARYTIAGGASERPRGPGYGAGLHAWATGAWRPLGPGAS